MTSSNSDPHRPIHPLLSRNTNWGRSWNLLLSKRAVPHGKRFMLALNPKGRKSMPPGVGRGRGSCWALDSLRWDEKATHYSQIIGERFLGCSLSSWWFVLFWILKVLLSWVAWGALVWVRVVFVLCSFTTIDLWLSGFPALFDIRWIFPMMMLFSGLLFVGILSFCSRGGVLLQNLYTSWTGKDPVSERCLRWNIFCWLR